MTGAAAGSQQHACQFSLVHNHKVCICPQSHGLRMPTVTWFAHTHSHIVCTCPWLQGLHVTTGARHAYAGLMVLFLALSGLAAGLASNEFTEYGCSIWMHHTTIKQSQV